MVVRLAGAGKQDIQALNNLMVTGNGVSVALGQVAEIGLGSGPKNICRVDKQRSITVTANVKNRPLGDFMGEVKHDS